MTPTFLSRASLALALMLATAPSPLLAQEVVQPLPGTTDADRLGDVMRRVAQNPRDVNALIEAAQLSIHLDDLSGAASLLARAEKVDVRDPRIKAGMASILVRSERPGEALRYFAQAEAAGLPAAQFAADRGLATSPGRSAITGWPWPRIRATSSSVAMPCRSVFRGSANRRSNS